MVEPGQEQDGSDNGPCTGALPFPFIHPRTEHAVATEHCSGEGAMSTDREKTREHVAQSAGTYLISATSFGDVKILGP